MEEEEAARTDDLPPTAQVHLQPCPTAPGAPALRETPAATMAPPEQVEAAAAAGRGRFLALSGAVFATYLVYGYLQEWIFRQEGMKPHG